MNERAIEFLKAQGVEVETRDASEVPGAYSVPVVKAVVHEVAGFDRVELRHVITAERHKNYGAMSIGEG
jgi:6,7-dimethyl-8-ribityllumazine synthase